MKRNIAKNPDDNYITPKLAGTVFSVAILAAIISAGVFSVIVSGVGIKREDDTYIYLSFVLPSLFVALFVAATFIVMKTDFSLIGGFFDTGFKKRYLFVLLLAAAGMLFGLSELNNYFIKFLGLFGYVEPKSSLPDYSPLSLVLCILFIAVVPPLVEETVFRGLVQGGIKKWGYMSVILTAAMFSLFHLSPAKTVYQFVCGLLFSLIAMKTGSVIPTIIVHFLNNLLIILDIYFHIFSFVADNRILFTVLGLLALAGALAIIFTDGRKIERSVERSGAAAFFINAAVGLFIGTIVWVASLFVG
ncbi:MAG: CPBP family intramembrane metalloprotease [Clostridia bacterium]|nr:CPBP family intramembrane metalloprotease [Clostridia bacterium]